MGPLTQPWEKERHNIMTYLFHQIKWCNLLSLCILYLYFLPHFFVWCLNQYAHETVILCPFFLLFHSHLKHPMSTKHHQVLKRTRWKPLLLDYCLHSLTGCLHNSLVKSLSNSAHKVCHLKHHLLIYPNALFLLCNPPHSDLILGNLGFPGPVESSF